METTGKARFVRNATPPSHIAFAADGPEGNLLAKPT
jgi:hypothetical protein